MVDSILTTQAEMPYNDCAKVSRGVSIFAYKDPLLSGRPDDLSNHWRTEGSGFLCAEMTKRIPLTQGKFAIIDDEDYPCVSKRKWCAQKARNTFYAVSCE